MKGSYFGPSYDNDEILNELKNFEPNIVFERQDLISLFHLNYQIKKFLDGFKERWSLALEH